MTRDLDPEEADYSKRLFDAVLNLVVTLDQDDAGTGGFVRPHLVRMAMADVAAMVDNNCQMAANPRDRRKLAEDLRDRYVAMVKSLQAADAAGDSNWPKAKRVDPDTVN